MGGRKLTEFLPIKTSGNSPVSVHFLLEWYTFCCMYRFSWPNTGFMETWSAKALVEFNISPSLCWPYTLVNTFLWEKMDLEAFPSHNTWVSLKVDCYCQWLQNDISQSKASTFFSLAYKLYRHYRYWCCGHSIER